MNIGKKIRELRKEKGLTIREVAEKAGCTASFLSQLERGKTEPSIAMLKKIADVLNVNIVDFFMDGVNDDHIVTRSDERVLITLKRWDAEIYSLVKSLSGKRMQPFYKTQRGL
jgi:transcriptional regulator with XRE-family HTH domain